ncbi:hypothetical protein MCESTEH50_00882 [Candidatus Methylopumilus universalis]
MLYILSAVILKNIGKIYIYHNKLACVTLDISRDFGILGNRKGFTQFSSEIYFEI